MLELIQNTMLLCANRPEVWTIVAAARGAVAIPAHAKEPGMFIKIGGRRIAAEFAGIGTPTVVFDAFGGAGTDAWAPLWSAVTAFTHACRVIRTGQSDPFLSPSAAASLSPIAYRIGQTTW